MQNKSIHIIWGGTVDHIRPHLSLTAPAYWQVARNLQNLCEEQIPEMDTHLHLTKMASSWNSKLETNEDIEELVNTLIEDYSTKIIFFTAAMTDYSWNILESWVVTKSWKDQERLSSRSGNIEALLTPKEKIIQTIRKTRKDIFLVWFKTTAWASEDEQYIKGLNLVKTASANLVLANDIKTRTNMIITPEEARYHVGKDRNNILENLVDMAHLRSQLSFTRSTVISWESISWDSTEVPSSLKEIVDYCINQGAYKEFRWSTVGHFAFKKDDTTFGTSKRKTNFNDLKTNGLVRIETDGPDSILAYGAKPSVWGQSQRIIFSENPDLDCIVHFHCPIKDWSKVPVISQREYECWSHQCWENTARGLIETNWIHAVYLDNHGPNIVFNRDINPQKVIRFIQENFDLKGKTGGPVSL